VGAGSWVVRSHLPNLAKRGDCIEFVGACRTGAGELEHLRKEWGFQVTSQDYRDILRLRPDIVIVGSPAALHYEHALAALNAGAHVLVEKPFTIRSSEARSLVAVAASLNRHLVVSFGYNYRPIVLETRRHLEQIGGLGPIEFASVEMSSITRDLLAGRGAYPLADPVVRPEARTWADASISGGGYGQAQLSHALGVLLWLTALRGGEAYTLTTSAVGATVELYMSGVMRCSGGAIGTVSGSAAYAAAPGRDYLCITVVGARGELRMEFHNDLVRTYHEDRGAEVVQLPPEAGRYDCDGPPNALVDLALGIVQCSESPGELGLRTVEVLEALYASAAVAAQSGATPTPGQLRSLGCYCRVS
jgi:predicted dehydrogenase